MQPRIYLKDVPNHLNNSVTIHGWCDTVRDHGGLLFIDLRDKTGVVQVVVNMQDASLLDVAKKLRSEFVITVQGSVNNRSADMVNPKIPTGSIEVMAQSIQIVSESKVLPFPINTDGREIDENLRLKYRYLDMRRDRIQKIIKLKSDFMLAVRNHMNSQDFTEVITPLLTSTSPEGARDFVVPSRLQPGKFFVLPQAPQQFKQLLMVGGLDKYYQIAPCARDEDPRADRHAGVFYQIDIEMSFPTIDLLFSTAENLIINTYKTVAPNKKLMSQTFSRIPFATALEEYGSDKPDIRFDLKLKNITEIVKGKTEFNIFNSTETIKCIVVPGAGEWSRNQIAEMEEFAKLQGAGGLAYVKVTASGLDTGIAKFLEPIASNLIEFTSAKAGDLIFFGADKHSKVNKVLGQVRLKLGDLLNLKDPNLLAFTWVTDFPFYEQDDKTGSLDFGHNPFSMPAGGMDAFTMADSLQIQSLQYDLALNGYEVLSGSIRNHDPEILLKAFELVGYTAETVKKRFGALYEAFQYGVPPHGGWAIGFDRLFMVLIDEPNIRDTYAFPLNSSGVDVLMNAPSELDHKDLKVLGIQLVAKPS